MRRNSLSILLEKWRIRMTTTEYEVKSNVKNNVKDALFRFLFDKDRNKLLQLYNALNGIC